MLTAIFEFFAKYYLYLIDEVFQSPDSGSKVFITQSKHWGAPILVEATAKLYLTVNPNFLALNAGLWVCHLALSIIFIPSPWSLLASGFATFLQLLILSLVIAKSAAEVSPSPIDLMMSRRGRRKLFKRHWRSVPAERLASVRSYGLGGFSEFLVDVVEADLAKEQPATRENFYSLLNGFNGTLGELLEVSANV